LALGAVDFEHFLEGGQFVRVHPRHDVAKYFQQVHTTVIVADIQTGVLLKHPDIGTVKVNVAVHRCQHALDVVHIQVLIEELVVVGHGVGVSYQEDLLVKKPFKVDVEVSFVHVKGQKSDVKGLKIN